MKFIHLALAVTACSLVTAPRAPAQEDARDTAAARSLDNLASRFRQARHPQAATLAGRWTMHQSIMRDRSSEGRMIERVFGARQRDIPGNPLEWVLEIRRRSGVGYEVTSHNPWEPTNDRSVIRFRATDITFEKETGSDTRSTYRCRVSGRRQLVCLNATGPILEGVEFVTDP